MTKELFFKGKVASAIFTTAPPGARESSREERRFCAFKFPAKLFDRLERESKKKFRSRSSIVYQATEEFLNRSQQA